MAVTVTGDQQPGGRGSIRLLKFAWTSLPAGDGAGTAVSAKTQEAFNADVVGLVTIPSGTVAPSDNYDVQVLDNQDIDVLAGAGADRHTSQTQHVVDETKLGYVADSHLRLSVANAGNEKAGTVYLFLRLR